MESLLINKVQDEILQKFEKCRTLIIVASTGSGKSTLIPKILSQNGYSDKGIIGISQPRRVAAISLAKRVGYILNCKVGDFVGVSVRFYNNLTSKTKILFLTDGILVREALIDPLFSRFSVVIVDEAHERSVRTDVLFGLLVIAQRKRPDLKVIIMSATLRDKNFMEFFNDVDVIKVSGKQHPVVIHHIKAEHEDFIEASVYATLLLNARAEPGDILVFLPGQEEIEMFCSLLKSKLEKVESVREKNVVIKIGKRLCKRSDWMEIKILPLYASLPLSQQELVFTQLQGVRKVIAATNIAETSLTIQGVKFVVDSGLEKQKSFSAKNGVEVLALKIISKSSALQRAGRSNRESRGFVYRIYTRDSYDQMDEFSVPEILRTNFTQIFLEISAIGISSISEFPLIDSPSKEIFLAATSTLCRIGALDRSGNITEMGKLIVKIPTDPIYAKLLLISTRMNCFEEVLTLVSMLSVDSPWIMNFNSNRAISKAKARIADPTSDHLTLINLYNLYKKSKNPEQFCQAFGVKYNVMKYCDQVRGQLNEVIDTLNVDNSISLNVQIEEFDYIEDEVLWALSQASWMKTAILQPDGQHYKTVLERQIVKIHVSSAISPTRLPKCIVYNECIYTSSIFVRIVSSLDKFDVNPMK